MARALILDRVVCPACLNELPMPTLSDFGYDRVKMSEALTTARSVTCGFGQGRPQACRWFGTAVFARWSDDGLSSTVPEVGPRHEAEREHGTWKRFLDSAAQGSVKADPFSSF